MKILVLCDDYWHPIEGIKQGLTPLFDASQEVEFITDASLLTAQKLEGFQTVVITKADEIAPDNYKVWKTEANQNALLQYVEGGGGLLVLHAGTVSGTGTQVFDQLVGCRFRYHPQNSAVTVSPLKPHPITAGIKPFTEVDEHYWIDILATDADILFASTSPAQGVAEKYESEPYVNCPVTVYPSGYTRLQGKGRVCVLTPGHLLSVWHQPEYQKTLKNALEWVRKIN